MTQLDWEKFKKNPLLFICFLGLVSTLFLWKIDQNKTKDNNRSLEERIKIEHSEKLKAQADRDSMFKLLVEKQTIDNILNLKK